MNCEKLADFFSTFSNPVRLKILCSLMQGENSVSEMIALLGINKFNLSHQLKILRLNHFIDQRREGKFIYYSIRERKLVDLLAHFSKEVTKLRGDLPS